MDRDALLQIRVTAELKRALVAAARAEERSLASLASRILSQWVERNGPKPKKDEPLK
jgi:predicted HicB family RNase H-like nuclease